MPREFLKPFAVKKGEPLRIPAEFSAAGVLTLTVLKGGPVFGFRGGVTEATAKSRTSGVNSNTDFDIAANSSHPSTIILEKDIGEITLFSEEDSIGFLQFIEC